MYIIVYFPLSYIYILCLMCWIMLDVAGGETTETGCIVTPLKVFCICFGGGLWLGRFTWCLSPSRVPAGMYLCQESPFISKAFISRWGNPSFQTTTIPVKGSLISNSPNQPYPTILWLSINKVNKVQLQITPGEKKSAQPKVHGMPAQTSHEGSHWLRLVGRCGWDQKWWEPGRKLECEHQILMHLKYVIQVILVILERIECVFTKMWLSLKIPYSSLCTRLNTQHMHCTIHPRNARASVASYPPCTSYMQNNKHWRSAKCRKQTTCSKLWFHVIPHEFYINVTRYPLVS